MVANALASLALDRFVSASSAEDAHSSLERILEALQNNKLKVEEDNTPVLTPEMIWSDVDLLNSLRHVLHTGKHKNQGDMEVPVDEGASLVCKIYMEMLEQESTKSPLLEKDEALLECLIDVISSSTTTNEEEEDGVIVSMYTRVLALQFLTKLCVKRPSLAQAQLLQAPNGLYRLGDLLSMDTEEIIRNEALLLAQVIAEWPSCAKIWMFSEVADRVILLALEEGGLTGGNLLVQDCLDLLFKLWKHDPNLADLVFQSPAITDNLPLLLDLRKGTEFLNPPKKATAAQKDDDLDDILNSAKESESKEDGVVVPRLTAAEEKVIQKTLEILALLLESDTLKQSVWNRQMNLGSLLWELSLVSPPPPQFPYVCAVPSPQLQQKALETVALYFHDRNTMERHAGLDRLLYLVCTGGLGSTLQEKMGMSQGALHVIRKTVSLEAASQMLMETLAPPMNMDEGQPPPPTVVHKLLNTVAENLTPTPGIDADRRKIFLAGALGGLSIFLTDQTSRDIMLRLTTTSSGSSEDDDAAEDDDPDNTTTTTSSLIESMLHAVGTMEEAQNTEDAFFSMTLLRFLCHWTVDTPAVVQTILSSNQSSIVLSALLGIKTKTESHKKGVAVLGKLLLGLCMVYMGDDEKKCGGWTRASIMELIGKKSGGVSKFTSSLEQFKSVHDFGDTMPWSVCELEFKVWSQWFAGCVLLVRKRVIQELTGSGDGEDEEDTDDEGLMAGGDSSQVPGGGSSSARSLQKLVYQQSQEIDELQQSLEKANEQINSQDHEISEYKRRVESAPSQLDNMLDEYSAKISELESNVKTGLEEKKSIEEKYKSELETRDAQIAALQKEVEESRAREKEARDETETLREEIESLSQAYTGLEQEYRQQQQMQESVAASSAETTTTTSEQQPGEAEQEGSQQQRPQDQQAITSPGAGSTEISALRAENERLRGDAQAADQWMAMAVEKMKVLGQQNAGLQTQLSQLRDGQTQSELQQQYQTLYGENQSLVHQQGQLQAHLDGLAKENQDLKVAIQQEQEHRMHIDSQLGGTTKELQATVSALEENRSESSSARSEFESRLGAMTKDLENATEEINRLIEQLDHQRQLNSAEESQALDYEATLTAKSEELDQLKGALESQASDANALRAEVTHLREQLNQQQQSIQGDSDAGAQASDNFEATMLSNNAEMEDLKSLLDRRTAEAESQRIEVSQLRDQLGQQQQTYGEVNARVMDESALAARQEVEGLKMALETKTSEEDIQKQMHANEVEALNNAMAKLQEDMETAKTELESVRKREQEQIYQRESRIRELEARLNQGTGGQSLVSANEIKLRNDEIAELKSANEHAQDWMAKAVEHHNMISQQLAKMATENTALTSQVRELKGKVANNDATLIQARAMEQESLAQTNRLKEAETSLSACKSELERVKGELSQLQSQSSDFAQVSAEVEHLRSQVGTLNVSIQEQTSVTEQLRGELSCEQASKGAMAEEVAALKAKLDDARGVENLSGEVARLQEQIQQLGSALKEKTTAYDQLSNEITVERESKATALNEVESLKERAGQLAGEVEMLKAKTESLGEESEQVTELLSQLRRAKEENANLIHTQKDDKGVITRLNEEIASLRAAPSSMATSQPAQGTNAQAFFSAGSSGGVFSGATTSAPEAAQQLFSAAPQASGVGGGAQEFFGAVPPSGAASQASGVVGGAQDFFGAAAPGGESAQGFFTAGQPTAGDQASMYSAEKARQVEQLEQQVNESRLELERAKAKFAEDESVLRERVSELETTVNKLQRQLKQETDDKTLQQSELSSLKEKNAELSKALESAISAAAAASQDTPIQQVRIELEETKTKLIDTLTRLEDDDNVIVQWEERVAELDSIVKDLKEELVEQEEAANSVIEQWQESCNGLEERNKELMQSLEESRAAMGTAGGNGQDNSNEALFALQADLDQTKTALAASQAKLEEACKGQESSNEARIALITDLEQTKTELAAAQAKLDEKEGSNGQEKNNEALQALQADLEQTRKALAAAQAKLDEDDHVVVKWEERVAGLECAVKDMELQLSEQEENASTVIARWQESCTALEEKNAELLSSLESFGPGELISKEALQALQERLQETEVALAKAKENLKDDDDVVLRWQGLKLLHCDDSERVAELESASEEFAAQMGQQEEDAKSAIAKWRESCTALEEQSQNLRQQLGTSNEKKHELGEQLQETQRALDYAKASLREYEVSLAKWQERVSELEEIVKDLQTQLSQQEEEAENAIGKWQENCHALEEQNTQLSQELAASNVNANALQAKFAASKENESKLQAKLAETQKALDEAKRKVKDDEEAIAKQQELVSELEDALEDLETQLGQQEEETRAAIANWQGSCTALEEQNKKLGQQLQASNNDGAKMESQLLEARKGLDEAEKRIKEDEDVVTKWQERVSELETTVTDLQTQIREQEQEAEAAIAMWQESCSSLEHQKSELLQKLETSSEMEGSLKNQMEETQRALDEAEESLKNDEDAVVKWQERVDELESVVKNLETQLAEQEEEANNAIEVWQQNWTSLEERNSELVVSTESSNEQNEKLRQEAAAAQGQLNEAETALAAAKEASANNEEKATKLQEQIKELESVKSDQEEMLWVLEEKNAQISKSLDDTKEKLGEDEEKFVEQVKELEATISELEEQLTSEGEEAKNVIEQWEQSYKALQQQNGDLTESFEKVNATQQALQAELDDATSAIHEWEKSHKALEEQNKEMSVSSHKVNVTQRALQTELEETKQALAAARLAEDKEKSEKSGLLEEYQAHITDLEQQLEVSEEEASSAIAQWQETVATLEASKKELTEALDKSTDAQQSMQSQLTTLQSSLKETEESLAKAEAHNREEKSLVAGLQKNLNEKQEELRKAQEQVEALEAELNEKEASLEDLSERVEEDEHVVNEWEKRTGELEAEIEAQKAELEEQENEASDAISKWQERCTQLEMEKNELSQLLQAAINRNKDLTDENDSLESSSQAQMTESVDALTAEKARANDLKEQLAELESMVNLLQQRLLDSEKGTIDAREQIAELESMINMMQQRLLDSEKEASAKSAEVESMVNLMQQRLLDSEKEASAARKSLQEKSKEYEAQSGELSTKLQEAQAKVESLERTMQSTGDTSALEAKVVGLEDEMKVKDREMANAVAEWQQHCVDLESKNTELSNTLDAIRKDPEFEGSPEEHIADLEAHVKSLEEELEEAEGIVDNWQESYHALETRNGKLELELEAARSGSTNVSGDLKLEVDELKSKLATSEAVLSSAKELEAQYTAKQEELAQLSNQLEKAIKERDEALVKVNLTEGDDSTSMQDIPVDTDVTPDAPPPPPQQNENDKLAILELTAKTNDLEVQVDELRKERDTANAALDSMKETSRFLSKELEDSKAESVVIVNQWTERTKQLEALVSDLEEQLEQQVNEATDAISSWDSRCSELQESLNLVQAELENRKAELIAFLKSQLENQDKFLATYSDNYEPDTAIQGDAEISVDVLRSKTAEKQVLIGDLLAKKESDINTLFTEMEQLRSSSRESQAALANENETTQALNVQIENLKKQIAQKDSSINQLKSSLTNEESVASHVTSLESKIAELEQQVEEEGFTKETIEEELRQCKEKLSKFVHKESMVEAELEEVRAESNKRRETENLIKSDLEEAEAECSRLRESVSLITSELGEAKAKNSNLQGSDSLVKRELNEAKAENSKLQESANLVKSELDGAKAEISKLRESLSGEKEKQSLSGEKEKQSLALQQKVEELEIEKSVLEHKVEHLSKQSTELNDELQDANNAVQVYVAKEVSDRATAMAAHALREQLHEIRKQADADREAYAVEKDNRIAAEREVERLRTDLFALVDITDQENELYGTAALTIKAADKIHRKERSEITELRKSLTRALEELRVSRSAEKDAEERAAKASHHIVVCEQELAAAKSDMRYLIQTMDEMRQDEASRRASMEHRIRTLETDHDVLRRFHSSETDSLRSELTQAVLEKDRTLQLLKDSEKNNAAMLYAASKEHPSSPDESPEAELAKLRIEKAQLLVAAAEEGERTERRLREVIATEVSSAEADVLVERERRLAAEAASENMKLLVVELQKDVQSYKEDIALGSYSPRKAKMEHENERLRQEIAKLSEESASLRTKLDAAESAQENANYRIEKLEADCRIAQASSNRLDREIKFHSEVQAEMSRMRTTPVAKTHAESDPAKEKTEDDHRMVELYDKIHEQAEAMQRAREVHQSLQTEHEDLLALLAQQEETKRSLESALAGAAGQMAVDQAIREAEESSIAQYGRCVRVSTP